MKHSSIMAKLVASIVIITQIHILSNAVPSLAAGISTLNVIYNNEDMSVNVTGITNAKPGKHLTIVVLKPGASFDNVESNNPLVTFKCVDQTMIQQDGSFSMYFYMDPNDSTGVYQIKADGFDIDEGEGKSTTFYFLNPSEAVRMLNEATEGTIVNIFDTVAIILGFDLNDKLYTDLGNNQILVKKMMKGKTLKSPDDARQAYKDAVMTVAVNKALNKAAVAELINRMENYLGIDLDDRFFSSSFGADKQDRVIGIIADHKDYQNAGQIAEMLKNAVEQQLSSGTGTNSTPRSGSSKGTTIKASSSAAGSGLASPQLPTVKKSFTDLYTVIWAADDIQSLVDAEILTVPDDGKYYPEENITREEFLKMLVAGFGLLDETAESSFNDVNKTAWYYKYIASAQKLGITGGMGDGNFGVGKKITRQEMSVLAYKSVQTINKKLKSGEQSVTFADQQDIAPYAMESVQAMRQAGIIKGMEDGSFAPLANATRAQAAVVVERLLKN